MTRKHSWRLAAAAVAVAVASPFASDAQADDAISTGDGLLSLTAVMPEEVRVGEEFTYNVTIANTSDNVTIHDIELRQLKAKGFSVESTSSSAKPNGKSAKEADSMMIAMLMPGQSETISVKASANEEGELRSCLAIVDYMPAICLTSQVVKPQLELTKVAPKQADRCNVILLEYTVKNGGSGDVGPFSVTDSLGEGLATIEGNNSLKFDVDGLSAGDSRKFVARVYASKPGEFTSRAVAAADNSELKSRSQETTTNVIAADLDVRLDGPGRLYGEQLATFTGSVTNTGNSAAEDVRVNVLWPEAANMVDMGDARMTMSGRSSESNSQSGGEPTLATNAGGTSTGGSDQSDNQDVDLVMVDKSFTIGRLEAGQTAMFEYAIRPGDLDTLPTKVVARYICTVDAADDEADATSEAVAMAMARVEIVRLPAMQLVVLDDEDPVAKQSNVVYSIRVWNEGDANDSNVTLKAEIPEGLEFVSAKGPTEHSVEGSTVSFKPIGTMEPGDRADYKVTAKCVGNGDVRFGATLSSKSLQKEVTGEEPTRLFSRNAK